MNISSITAYLSVSIIILSGLFYLFYAMLNFKEITINSFLLADRNVSGNDYANTFYATVISLESVILFFLASHKKYGWTMTLAVVIYTITQMYILRLVKNINIDFKNVKNISDLWFSIYPSKKIARILSAFIFIGCLLGVFVELFFGSVILSVFLPDTPFFKAVSFFILGLLLLTYVCLGGYKTVIRTDKWQINILLVAVLVLIGFTILISPVNFDKEAYIFAKLFHHTETGFSLYTFSLWVILINVLLCFMDVSNWQRMSAVVSIQEAEKGLRAGIWKFLVIVFGLAMSLVMLASKGYEFNDLPSFLQIIYNEGGYFSYIVFLFIVLGFVSALFSTADTFLIGALYVLCGKNVFLTKLGNLSHNHRSIILMKYLLYFAICVLCFLTILYYIHIHEIAKYFVPILYSVWWLLLALATLPIYALFRIKYGCKRLNVTKSSENILLLSISTCCIICMIGCFYEINTKQMIYAQVSNIASVLTMIIGLTLITLTNK